jgi:hypothetical protein
VTSENGDDIRRKNKEGFRKVLNQLREYADEWAQKYVDVDDIDFVNAMINIEGQLLPQLEVYGPELSKTLSTWAVVTTAEVRKELQLGTKVVEKVSERTTVLEHDASGRIKTFEKSDCYGVVDA